MINFESNTKYCFVFEGFLLTDIEYNITLSVIYGNKADFIIEYNSPIDFLIEITSAKELIYEIDEETLSSFALAKFPCEFLDGAGILTNLFTSDKVKFENITLEVMTEEESKFIGSIDPLSIVFNKNDLILLCGFKPETYIINETDTWINNSINYSAIGINLSSQPILLIDFIERVYKIVKPNLLTDFSNGFSFMATDENFNPPVTTICNAFNLFIDERLFGDYNNGSFIGNGIDNFGGIIKQLAFSLGAVTGMISSDKAIFIPFFDSNKPTKIINENQIISFKVEGNRDLITYLKLNPSGDYTGIPTNISGKYISKDIYLKYLVQTNNGFLTAIMLKTKDIWESISIGLLNYWQKYFLSKNYCFNYTVEVVGINYNLWEDIIIDSIRYIPIFVKINLEEYKTVIKLVKAE